MKILNRIIGGSIAAAAAFALSASTTQAQGFPNDLVNGSFEDASGFFPASPSGPSGLSGVDQGWALFHSANGLDDPIQSDMTFSIDSPENGNYALLAQNAPGINWDPAGAYQIVSGVTAGELYTFGIRYLTDTSFTGNYDTPVMLNIRFLDASLNFLDFGGSSFGSGIYDYADAPGIDTWTYSGFYATAPEGAEYVYVAAMFIDNGQTTTENLYFDNAVLWGPTPEPSTLALVGTGLAVSFCFIRRRKS